MSLTPIRALSLLVTMVATSCRAQAQDTVVVFAAASLSEPFRGLERAYETAHPGVDVVLNLAGSQLLASQLIEGAPADVFASADAHTLERVLVEKPDAQGSRRVFASNRVVVVVAADSQLQSLEQLRTPGLRIVLAGPEVPVGRYARAALDQLGLRAAVEGSLVSNEDSVNGVLAKVALGEADAGIAYATDLARSPGLRGIAMPTDVSASYELAVLGDGPNAGQGAAFAAFVVGAQGQAVLREYGFSIPPG
ncbi:Molybdenum ABC transporter, periplasmic molybdenum-binding protein ModA [Enhygromyxa salina]|uniref:Molybdenum ABC transporter, periplasmic molybdenum-binding protein ModA n=1 Tax=Enhygromyxa salina TaxID=215803 RepID=A0A0C1ZR00_9BACT|nr:Molybdenum ABC transporter, periplasmic molybdenum-binding protein ModA [Enhygromyxa salina]